MKTIKNISYIVYALLVFSAFSVQASTDNDKTFSVTILGDGAANENDIKNYTISSGSITIYAANWSVTGGVIQSQTNTTLSVRWTTPGMGQITYNVSSSSSGTLQALKSVTVAVAAPNTPPNPSILSQNCGTAEIQNTASIPSGEMWYWQGVNQSGTDTSYPATSTYTVTTSGDYALRALNTTTNVWSSLNGMITVTLNTNSGQVWYADTDGDGLGDPNDSLTGCDQPNGYVSNSDDQCPATHGQGSATGCAGTQSLTDQNYVYTITAQKATTNIENTLQNERDSVQESVTYFDGLGRSVQSIGIRQSPTKKDIVSHVAYDAYGRQTKEYLPYASTESSGFLKANPLAATENFYNTVKYDHTTNPYSEKVLETSPLARIIEQTAPGNDWLKGANQVSGKGYSDGHSIRFEYDINTGTEVRLYEVSLSFANNTYTPTLTETGHYPLGELTKTITKDENWVVADGKNHTTEEFKDKNGQVILKRTYASTGSATPEAHDTYYVYDDYGNLSYVLPPKVDTSDGVSTTELDELGYQYKYDNRNRLVEKKIPGKGWEYIVYDKLDRPVMTQDAIQATNKEWLFTKYDLLGRVVYTGIYTESKASTREAMQSSFSSQNDTAFNQYEAKVSSGTGLDNSYYTNNNFPTTNLEVLTVNYYDDYSFDLAGSDLPGNIAPVYSEPLTANVVGLSTGSKVKILESNPAKWTTTITYYDKKARPVYVYSKNEYLNTTDVVQSKLDFTGRVLETTSLHTNTNDSNLGTQTIVDAMSYDHTGRLVSQTQNINGSAHTEMIVSNTYDELGQLESKGVGGDASSNNRFQTVDYRYNVRGWLTSINEDEKDDDDLFNFSLRYNNPTTGEGLYNGNIAQISWNSLSSDKSKKTYTYTYDALNRITSGIDNTGNYNLTSVSYDTNGNILILQREGHVVANPNSANATDFGVMDDLTYSYTNGNQLASVSDAGNTTYGFKDVTGANDYSYDINGNMTADANKGITSIAYNHLNLPTKVVFNGNDPLFSQNPEAIEYVYDAAGVKLRKVVTNGTSNVTTTDYAGNFIYEKSQGGSHTLQFFNHAEGYTQATVTSSGVEMSNVYQYKDHLGNVRLSYIGNGTGDTIFEDDFSDGTPAPWSGSFGYEPVSVENEQLKCSADINYRGVSVNISLEQGKSYKVAYDFDMTGMTAQIQVQVYGPTGLYNSGLLTQGGSFSTTITAPQTATYKLRFYVIDPNIPGASTPFASLQTFYVDNVKVTEVIDLEIVEESNYYPFGLKHKGYNNLVSSNGNSAAQKWGYQGQELSEDLGYNMQEYKFRHYDPSTGRFVAIDPLAEKYVYNSTFAFQENKLGLGTELEGKELKYLPWLVNDAVKNPNGVGAHTLGFSQGLVNGAKGVYDLVTNPIQALSSMGSLIDPLPNTTKFAAFDGISSDVGAVFGEDGIKRAEVFGRGTFDALLAKGLSKFSKASKFSNFGKTGNKINISAFDDFGDFFGVSVKSGGKSQYLGSITTTELGTVMELDIIVPKIMRNKGILSDVVQAGVNKINPQVIRSTWAKHFNGGDSVNYKVFLENLKSMSPSQAALNTPSGKAAAKAGYGNAKVVNGNNQGYIVDFTKN